MSEKENQNVEASLRELNLVRSISQSGSDTDQKIYLFEKYLECGEHQPSIEIAYVKLVSLYKKTKEKGKVEFYKNLLRMNFGHDSASEETRKNNVLLAVTEKCYVPPNTVVLSPNQYPLSLSQTEYVKPEILYASFLASEGWVVYKTENCFWWALQSLLYYEEIFAQIEGQRFTGSEGIGDMPSDFFRGGPLFYKRREKLLIEKNQLLLKHSCLLEAFEKRFQELQGKKMRHFCKDHITKDGLILMTKHIAPKQIVSVLDRINSHVVRYRTGLPDLLAIHESTKRYRFIEIKREREKISHEQEGWIDYFIANGLNVNVVRVSCEPDYNRKLFRDEMP